MEEKSKKATQEGADYEKKYKELVGKIEKAYLYALTDSTKAVLEEIRSELQESEDEKIRKEIIDYIIGDINGKNEKCKSCLAWLEKQGEQKPKWGEEDERGSDETIELLEYFNNYAPKFRRPAIKRSIDWLNSLKQRLEE